MIIEMEGRSLFNPAMSYEQFMRLNARMWNELRYVHFWDEHYSTNYKIAMQWAHPEPAD